MPLLDIRDLSIAFPVARGAKAVDGISLQLEKGRTLALVGESGSGKSVTALAIPRLLPPGTSVGGKILFAGEDITHASEKHLRGLRGIGRSPWCSRSR